MPEFRNMSEIAKYFSGSQQFLGQADLIRILKEEAQRLEKYLKEEINNYYASYTPKVYHRTYDWINSIRVSEPKLEGSTMSIKIYFDDSMAYHPSIFNGEKGFVPWLYENGFSWSAEKQPRVYRLSDYEGFHAVRKACDKYNENNPYKFHVTIESLY